MADNINFNIERNTHSFYSLKQIAWHNLGTVVEEAKTVEEIKKIANLDYTVQLAEITADIKSIETIQSIIIPDKLATYRTDTNDVFSIVSNRYEVLQNDVIINLVQQIQTASNNNLIIETAGVLGKGERIFITCKLPSIEIEKEDIDRYIIFTSSHDGSLGFTMMITNIRVVCNNTLIAALNTSDKITFKHCKNINDNVKLMMKYYNLYNNEIKDISEIYSLANKIQVNSQDVKDAVASMLLDKTQFNQYISYKNIDGISDEIVSTRLKNKYFDILGNIENGVGQQYNRGSMYWLYNGITTYIQNGSTYKNNEDMFKSIYEGKNRELNVKAFHYLVNQAAA